MLSEKKEETKEETSISTDYHSKTILLLSKVLSGQAPEGYGVRDVYEMDLNGMKWTLMVLKTLLRAQAIKAFEGPFETLFLFKISNRSRGPASIDKNTLKVIFGCLSLKKPLFPDKPSPGQPKGDLDEKIWIRKRLK